MHKLSRTWIYRINLTQSLAANSRMLTDHYLLWIILTLDLWVTENLKASQDSKFQIQLVKSQIRAGFH